MVTRTLTCIGDDMVSFSPVIKPSSPELHCHEWPTGLMYMLQVLEHELTMIRLLEVHCHQH